MVDAVSRETVNDFHAALASRDASRIVSFVADEVDWLMIGPVDVMPFFGQRHSKAEVYDIFARQIPDVLEVTGYAQEYLLVDADLASSLDRLTATQRRTGRTISYRLANFMRFRDGKIVALVSLVDTLDAAEQLLGRQIDLSVS
jgi:ketosteroid isomerase-like protein